MFGKPLLNNVMRLYYVQLDKRLDCRNSKALLAKLYRCYGASQCDEQMPTTAACMQTIQLSGYTEMEKRHIARRYLEKEVRKGCAIPEGSVELTDGALDVIIQQYSRESGVRGLKKQLEKVFRKVALALATSEHVTVRSAPGCVRDSSCNEGV